MYTLVNFANSLTIYSLYFERL